LKVDVNWSEFLAKHDMVWNFTGGGDKLPQLWTEEAFFGNGLLGASVRVLEIDTALVLRYIPASFAKIIFDITCSSSPDWSVQVLSDFASH
jgi:hypothetical protein